MVKVLAPEMNEVLELRGFISQTKRSFTLLYQKLPIRRYDNSRHTNPDGNVIEVPHKHTWDENLHDSYAYIPNDIDPDGDINSQLFEFLAEQNITFRGNYQHIIGS